MGCRGGWRGAAPCPPDPRGEAKRCLQNITQHLQPWVKQGQIGVPSRSRGTAWHPLSPGRGCLLPAESVQQLTPCEHERLYPRAVPPGPSPVGDGHVPQCDEEGRYRPLQCHGSTGYCWCVDAAGQEIAGTRTAPGSTPPRCGSPG